MGQFEITVVNPKETHKVEVGGLVITIRTPLLTEKMKILAANEKSYKTGMVSDIDIDLLMSVISGLTISIKDYDTDGEGKPIPPILVYQGLKTMGHFLEIATAISKYANLNEDAEKK